MLIKTVSIMVCLCSGSLVPLAYTSFPEYREYIELIVILVGFIGSILNIKGSEEILSERSKRGDIYNKKDNGVYKNMPSSLHKAKMIMIASPGEIMAIKNIISSVSKSKTDINSMMDSISKVRDLID